MFHISMGNNGAVRGTFLLYLPTCTGKVVTDIEKANVLEEKPHSHPSDPGAVEAAKLKLKEKAKDYRGTTEKDFCYDNGPDSDNRIIIFATDMCLQLLSGAQT